MRKKFVAFGKCLSLEKWFQEPECKVGYNTLKSRIKHGWDLERALTTFSKIKSKFEAGQRFGKLVLLEKVGSSKLFASKWLCLCDCGNKKVILVSSLQQQKTKSCGCYNKEISSKNGSKRSLGVLGAQREALRRCKRNSIQSKKEWSISDKDFYEIVASHCYYCGRKPFSFVENKNGTERFYCNGLDRVDNKMGYIINNIVSCCSSCNFGKHVMSEDDFYNWVKILYLNLVKNKRINIDNPQQSS